MTELEEIIKDQQCHIDSSDDKTESDDLEENDDSKDDNISKNDSVSVCNGIKNDQSRPETTESESETIKSESETDESSKESDESTNMEDGNDDIINRMIDDIMNEFEETSLAWSRRSDGWTCAQGTEGQTGQDKR